MRALIFLLLVACAAAPPPRAAALADAPSPGRACIGDDALVVCTDDAGWVEAESRCESAGMQLAIVKDDATQSAIERLLRRADAFATDAPWIGLRKQGAGLAWIDGTAATFVDFTAGEPNGGGADACIHLNWPPGSGTWNDARCDDVEAWNGYVCQRP